MLHCNNMSLRRTKFKLLLRPEAAFLKQ
jgi:hypothetical protein